MQRGGQRHGTHAPPRTRLRKPPNSKRMHRRITHLPINAQWRRVRMLKVEEIQVDLTRPERETIRQRLGREPNPTELGMIDVMWSEHCSYKSSRSLLKLLPNNGTQVLVGPGYDAGVVDIGDGYAAAFKLESHNHPSAIEPYNGS